MVVKIQKYNFFKHFQADTEVCVISNGAKDTPLQQLSLSILYLFDSIFPGIVLIEQLHFEEGTCFPINGCHGNKKKAIFHLSYQRLL